MSMTRENLIKRAYELVDTTDISGIVFTLSNLSNSIDESTYSAEDLNSSLLRNGFGNEYHFDTLVDFSTRYTQLIHEATTNPRSMSPGDFGYRFQRISFKTSYDDDYRRTSGWKIIKHSMVRIEVNERGSGVNSAATGEAATLTLKIRVGQKGSQIETYPLEVELGDTGNQADLDYIKKNIVDPFDNVVRNQLNPNEISLHVYGLATKKLNAISLRNHGGIYFVPGTNARSLIKLIESVCSEVGRIHPMILPISGDDAISKASIAETVNNNIVADMEKLIATVDKYSDGIISGDLKAPRMTTIMDNLKIASEMKKRAEQHALALEFDALVFNDRFSKFIESFQKSQRVFNDFKSGALSVGGQSVSTGLDYLADNSADSEEADL